MGPRRAVVVALLAVIGASGLSSPLAVAGEAEESTAQGPHVVVRAIGEHEGLAAIAAQSRDVIEAAVPTLERRIGVPLPKDVRLDVRVFVARGDLQAAFREDGVDPPEGVFAASQNRVCYVLVQPTADPELLRRIGGLPALFRSNLVHECVHQWIERTWGAGMDVWPLWYAEGMAEVTAHEALAASAKKGEPASVCEDMTVDVAQYAVEADDWPGLDAVLRPLADAVTPRYLYPVATDFYAWLSADAAGSAKWTKALAVRRAALSAEERSLAAAEGAATAVREALVEAYGPLDELERRWKAALVAKKPAWRRIDGGADRVGDAYVFGTGVPARVRLFAGEAPPASGFTLTFDLDLSAGADAFAAVYLGRQEPKEGETGLRLLLARTGTVTLQPAIAGQRRADLDCGAALDPATFPAGRFVPVRLDVRPRQVLATIAGRRVASWDLDAALDATAGRWGIGSAHGVVSFRAPKATPLPAK